MQTAYVAGALEVLGTLGMRCRTEFTTGDLMIDLRAAAKANQIPITLGFADAIGRLLDQRGCYFPESEPLKAKTKL